MGGSLVAGVHTPPVHDPPSQVVPSVAMGSEAGSAPFSQERALIPCCGYPGSEPFAARRDPTPACTFCYSSVPCRIIAAMLK